MKFYKSIKSMLKHYDYVKEIGENLIVSLENIPNDMKDIIYEVMKDYPCCIFSNINNHIYVESEYKNLCFDIYLKKSYVCSSATWKRCYTYIEIMGYTVTMCETQSRYDDFEITKVKTFGKVAPFEQTEIIIWS